MSMTTMSEQEEQVWTCIASETEDEHGRMIPVPGAAGQQTRERHARFAFRQEALDWLDNLGEGWEHDGPIPCATRYYGPTDSPSNCWSVRATRPL